MDPNATIDILGRGGAQVVLAVVVVALGIVGWRLTSALLESYRDRIKDHQDWSQRYSDRLVDITNTSRDLVSVVNAALARLK